MKRGYYFVTSHFKIMSYTFREWASLHVSPVACCTSQSPLSSTGWHPVDTLPSLNAAYNATQKLVSWHVYKVTNTCVCKMLSSTNIQPVLMHYSHRSVKLYKLW